MKSFLKPDEKGQYLWEKDIFGKETKASPASMAELCRQLAFMLDAGVNFESAISAMLRSKNKDRRMKASLQIALESIIGGESLASAFERAGYFTQFMCSMCRIGEMSDNLPSVMSLLADYYEETAKNRESIRSALMYPAIVSAMMLFMIVASVVFILPQYALVFAASDVQLPFLTRALLGLSDLLITRWWIVLPIGILVIFLPSALIKSTQGRDFLEYCQLHLPPVSTVYRQIINLHIIQALSLLLDSHQHLADSVLAVADIIPNRKVSQDLQQVAAGLQEGQSFSRLIDKIPYIDPTIANMAVVGEETGNMAQAFKHASNYSRHKFNQMSMRLNKLVEPVVTLLLGLVLALVMLSIILPTFAMTEFVGF